MKNILFLLIVISVFGCSVNNTKKTGNTDHGRKYVIVLSMDGFRWDYPDIYNTPTLDSLEKAGVRAELIPVFPTKTFVNHYSLATGLYADHHGIVMNNFYAPDLKKYYSMKKDAGNGTFYGGEPAWVTAEKQGVKAATLFWVGSEAAIEGIRPTYWFKYNQSMPFEDRIDTVISWLQLPYAERPHLIMWYYHEPDYTGHRAGPVSKETGQVVEQLDKWLRDFFTKVKTLPVYDSINFIILSDHGMAALSPDKQIIIDDHIDTAMLEIREGGNPVYNLKAKKGYEQKVFDALKSVEHLQVWQHGKLPERLHYGNNARTLDMTLVADPGWSLYWSWSRKRAKGTHGYDNAFRDMHAIFYASGPDIRKNAGQKPFINVDVYPIITKLLDLEPDNTDGDLNEVDHILK
jgi:alkaline phosphatase D